METLQQELFAPRTQKDRILARLIEAGDKGVSNVALNEIAFRYSARLHDLRRDGYKISAIHIKDSLFNFVLHQDAEYEELEPTNWWGKPALND